MRYRHSNGSRTSFEFNAGNGDIEGITPIHKFGFAGDVGPGDGESHIWDGTSDTIGGKISEYNFILTPLELSISSNGNDTVEMLVEGLDENGIEKVETVTLTGTTSAPLTGLWSAVNRAYNNDTVDLVGTVFIYDTGAAVVTGRPTDDLVIRTIVLANANQTQQAVFTVPSDSDLLISHGWCHISKQISTEAIVTVYKKDNTEKVFRILTTIALQTTGSSGDHREYVIPLKLEGGSTIAYKVTSFSNNTALSAGFHGMIVKKVLTR